MILAIGYRVTMLRAVQFRKWATTVLTECLIKGFALQDERLKDPSADYFDELLERIRDIRASERRFNQKVREIFKATMEKSRDRRIVGSGPTEYGSVWRASWVLFPNGAYWVAEHVRYRGPAGQWDPGVDLCHRSARRWGHAC